MPRVSRPVARGTNARGAPTFDGQEFALYRRSLRVPQSAVAVRLAMHQEAISFLYENKRAAVNVRADKVEKYLAAVERAAEAIEQDAVDAAAELAALRRSKYDERGAS